MSGRVRVDVGWVTREARGEAIPVVVVRRTGAPWEVCAVEWDEAGRAALRIVEAPEWGLQEVGFGELERSVVTRGRWNRVTGRWVSGHSVVTNIFPLRYDVMPGHVKAWTDVQMESILRGVVERLGSVEFDPYTATMVAAFGAEREGEIIVRRARGEALIRSVGVVRAMLSWWWWLLLSAVLIGVWRRVVGQRLRRRRLGALRVLCPACGYRAGTARAAVCSECGHVLDRRLGPAVPTA